jgi:hypothetical protein|uniref:Uncharacterized protein n=1 Tax=Oryza rufipogon TaxID=4529 RepID=A0A0E0R317_ORYRU
MTSAHSSLFRWTLLVDGLWVGMNEISDFIDPLLLDAIDALPSLDCSFILPNAASSQVRHLPTMLAYYAWRRPCRSR